MSILKDGKVGIGKTPTTFKLEVAGDVALDNNYGVKLYGTGALTFNTYGGGWYMNDSGWIRAVGDKGIYTAGGIQSDSLIHSANFETVASNSYGYKFWASDSYKIYMSTTADGGLGGAIASGSDYNMYFKMSGATRGFVFKTNTGNVAQITDAGKVYAEGGFQTKKYSMEYNATEDSMMIVYN
jgi:hypothetical protein